MSTTSLPIQIRAFIEENISSYEDLQVLLLLRSCPQKSWNVVEVAEQLRIEPFSASAHLIGLFKKGLLRHEERKGPFHSFQYHPHPEPKESRISELQGAFAKDRLEVVNYIKNKSSSK